ncbi:PilT/PilU family type 4a pilus ATPase [bacterium]|nr:PilT/PilU family type 4a pilus ATPase [bacterium]
MDVRGLLELLFVKKASDLHLRVGSLPVLRIDGELYATRSERITGAEMEAFLKEILTPPQIETLYQEKELDLAVSVPGHGRTRVNVYFQKGTPGLAIRSIKTLIPTFEELMLPPVMERIATLRRGIVLLTGATGSGKSTTLAAIIEYINSRRSANILTIEDPIEYLFSNKKSLIAQREVAIDTRSFHSALTHALREDPDVIMVGEIRDHETMKVALQAAETGHLVLTTLHTLNAVEAINRIISFFPLNEQGQVRSILSGTIQALVSQRLVPRADRNGRVPIVEVLVNTAAIRECLADPDKMHMLQGLLEDDRGAHGMQTFDQSILILLRQQYISHEMAMESASNPHDVEMAIRGINTSGSRLTAAETAVTTNVSG